MTLTPIRVNSSTIAAMLGRHPYTNRRDAILAVWKASDRDSYDGAHARCEIETPEQRKQRIRDYYPHLDAIARTTKPSLLSTKGFMDRDDVWKTGTGPQFLPDSSRHVVTKADALDLARETSYTGHGMAKERVVLDTVNTILGTAFTEVEDTLTREIGVIPGSDRRVILQGRPDAVARDMVLEIKTRARALFMRTKEYERIQVECYLYLTGASTGYLAEAYFPSQSSTDPDINISRIDRDDTYLTSLVEDITRHVHAIDRLMGSQRTQDTFLRIEDARQACHYIDS